MRTWTSALAVAASLAVAACGTDEPAASSDARSSSPDAELLRFAAPAVDGSVVRVGALRGEDVAIWFWAPW
jgi:hypothetical protein